MSEETTTNKPLPLWRRIVLVLIILAIVGLGGRMLAGYLIETRLDGKITAIHEAGYPVSFEQVAPPEDAVAANEAGALYTAALSNLPTGSIEDLVKVLSAYRNAIAAEALDQLPRELQPGIASILDQNQSRLNALDNAATAPLSHFDIGIKTGKDACVQKLNQIQEAMTIVSLRTTFLLGAKQYDLSAKSIITLLKTARVFDTYPTIMVSKAKQHFIRLACDDIRLLLSHGEASDAMLDDLAAALKDVLDSDAIENSLLAEQVYQIEASRNLFSEKVATDVLSQNVPDMPERGRLPETTLGKIKLRWFVLRYLDAMGNLIEVASKSRPELLKYVLDQKGNRSGKLNLVIGPVESYIETSIETAAFVRVTYLALQVEISRRAHGTVPHSLEAISQIVGPEIMTDPCSGKPMLYVTDDQSYTIYSTGLDGIDHGGATQSQLSPTTGQVEKKSEDIGLRILIPKE